jgi:hypothetical protein
MPGPFQVALSYDVERNTPSYIRSSGSVYSGMELMPEVIGIMRSHGVPGTWYLAHDVDPENQIARHFPGIVAQMADQGEIGCHVHFRDYDQVRTDDEFLRRTVGEATSYHRSCGHAVTGFRGGNLFMNPSLMRVLVDLGYTTDSTVLPGHRVRMPDGMKIDHTHRRSCEPYYPMAGDPWSGGGSDILEIPLSAYPVLSVKTPLISILLNYLVLISNLVLVDPALALDRLEKKRLKWPTESAVQVLTAHPHDFLSDRLTSETKLRNFDTFLGQVCAIPEARFATAAEIRASWAEPAAARATPRDNAPIRITTSTLRVARNHVRSLITGIPLG